eukprot:943134-Pyramimonas_sp.AAC.1
MRLRMLSRRPLPPLQRQRASRPLLSRRYVGGKDSAHGKDRRTLKSGLPGRASIQGPMRTRRRKSRELQQRHRMTQLSWLVNKQPHAAISP